MNSIQWSSLIISGVIGGIISSIFFPLVRYFAIRRYVTRNVDMYVDVHLSTAIRISNNSSATIKNAIAYIQVDFREEDFLKSKIREYRIFQFGPSKEFMMIAWARHVDSKNVYIMDINQGESPDLTVLSATEDNGETLMIASQYGLDRKNFVRTILNAKKDYQLQIRLTADNIYPITKRFKFNSAKKTIEGV